MDLKQAGGLTLGVAMCLAGCFGRATQGEVHLNDSAPSAGGSDFAMALYQSVGTSLVDGNRVRWVDNGEVFKTLHADVAHAKSSINLVTFIWSDGKTSDRLLGELADRVKAGAHCRLLIDFVGTLNPPIVLRNKLHASGCDVRWMRPVPGQDDMARDHRKLAIIDGRIGITGGFGIDDRWEGDGLSEKSWRDSAARVEGPVVRQMQQAFAENWQEAGGPLLPAADFPKLPAVGGARAAFVTSTENSVVTRADRLLQLLLSSARHRVWIQNAYFVPSEPLIGLLTRRAKEKLDVRVLAAGDKSDTKPYLPAQRARLDTLIQAGARGFEYDPAMMHAKTVLVDDNIVAVGSANLDALSLNKLDEGMLVVDDVAFASQLEAQWTKDLKHSKELEAQQ
jgi:cardiolipin synthase